MRDKIRWGIMGLGNIARTFASDLRLVPDAALAAVGSRSQEKAEAFASSCAETGRPAPRAYGSYEALAADPEIDVVYVATPHSEHMENALLCLEAGKAVLCEKAFTANFAQARQVADKARDKGLFLMEAMWTRFLPANVRVREWVASGAIGAIRAIRAEDGFRAKWDPSWRLLNPALAGGSLLDVGIYPISYVSMLLGHPEEVSGFADIGETGVDEQFSAVFRYGGGRMATVAAAVRTWMENNALIYGTEGMIRVPGFVEAKSAELVAPDGKVTVCALPFEGRGYQFEAAEVCRCLREGKTGSEIMPLDETLALMSLMDRLRAQWGLQYPFE